MRGRRVGSASLPYPVADYGMSQNLQHILSMVDRKRVDRATAPGVSPFLDHGNVSGTLVIDWSAAPVQMVRLTGNLVVQATGMEMGGTYILVIQKAGTPSITWDEGFAWPDGNPPPLLDTANSTDVATFVAIPVSGNIRAAGVLQWDFR